MSNFERRKQRKINNRLLIGVMIIIAGVLVLFRNLNVLFFPHFLFTWPMILIAVGLIIGARDNFKSNSWWIILLIGSYFLLMKNNPQWGLGQFFWPVVLIAVGLSFLLGRKKTRWVENDPQIINPPGATNDFAANAETTSTPEYDFTNENVVNATAVFGSVKKNVYSKDLRGGDISAIFGGVEINLMNADLDKEARLDITCVFGGCTLIIPSHWQIRSDAAAVFGGIDDERSHSAGVSTEKVLVIDGFVMFGGIEIKSGY